MTIYPKLSPSLLFSPTGLQALRDIATSEAGTAILCGVPVAGKTTATQLLAELRNPVVLDEDTFAPQLEESVMSELNGNPHDRDSDLPPCRGPTSLRRPGPSDGHEREAVPGRGGRPVPGYVETAAQRGMPLADYIRTITQVPEAQIRTVWVDTDTAQIRDRMLQRGAERDLPELSDWNTYRTTVLDSDLARTGPSVVDHVVTH
ncbi:hypothetical protein [Nocardia sp. NPDC004750]